MGSRLFLPIGAFLVVALFAKPAIAAIAALGVACCCFVAYDDGRRAAERERERIDRAP